MRLLQWGWTLLFAIAVVGCSASAAPSLPVDPAGVETPEEYAFGSDTASKDWRATRLVLDALEARFGEKSISVSSRNLPGTMDWQTVKTHYQTALPGWTEMTLAQDYRSQSWSFALVSPDGRFVLAIVALTPEAAGVSSAVPMSVLTNIPAGAV